MEEVADEKGLGGVGVTTPKTFLLIGEDDTNMCKPTNTSAA